MEEKFNKVPTWAVFRIQGQGWVEVEGVNYQYHLLEKKQEPRFPNFVEWKDTEFLFISEEVPAEYREFVLTHEVREQTVYRYEKGPCVRALISELGEVPRDMLPVYARWRLEFFEGFLAFLRIEKKDGDLEHQVEETVMLLRNIEAAVED